MVSLQNGDTRREPPPLSDATGNNFISTLVRNHFVIIQSVTSIFEAKLRTDFSQNIF